MISPDESCQDIRYTLMLVHNNQGLAFTSTRPDRGAYSNLVWSRDLTETVFLDRAVASAGWLTRREAKEPALSDTYAQSRGQIGCLGTNLDRCSERKSSLEIVKRPPHEGRFLLGMRSTSLGIFGFLQLECRC